MTELRIMLDPACNKDVLYCVPLHGTVLCILYSQDNCLLWADSRSSTHRPVGAIQRGIRRHTVSLFPTGSPGYDPCRTRPPVKANQVKVTGPDRTVYSHVLHRHQLLIGVNPLTGQFERVKPVKMKVVQKVQSFAQCQGQWILA